MSLLFLKEIFEIKNTQTQITIDQTSVYMFVIKHLDHRQHLFSGFDINCVWQQNPNLVQTFALGFSENKV